MHEKRGVVRMDSKENFVQAFGMFVSGLSLCYIRSIDVDLVCSR